MWALQMSSIVIIGYHGFEFSGIPDSIIFNIIQFMRRHNHNVLRYAENAWDCLGMFYSAPDSEHPTRSDPISDPVQPWLNLYGF